ncbi:MAG: MarR family transcriptional regulator [Acidobacteriaceae bacterium]|nr:MarR family transcriptional regulator [Acidobacteriaceae bacterium]MBV9779978.1 MarR family transcriptional regulator [Acidobacteriaceae bacterium]
MSLADLIPAFRRFNRAYTRLLETLNERYLRTEYSLAEGRVLYELATRSKPQAKEVAEALGLDAGYLSRILTKFEMSGLVVRAAARQDKRAAHLLLTARGRAAIRALNVRADKQARAILGGISPGQRVKFAGALRAIEETILGSQPEPPTIILRPHRPGDMGIVVRHREQPQTAKLRLLYVDPAARGRRLGQTLVAECVGFARTAGYSKITLWTQSILTAAHHIYQTAGFQLVSEQLHHSFGKDLIGQTWEMNLL